MKKILLLLMFIATFASAAQTNLFDNVRINNAFRFVPGAGAGLVLQSDASGNASWQPAGAGGGGDVFTTSNNTFVAGTTFTNNGTTVTSNIFVRGFIQGTTANNQNYVSNFHAYYAGSNGFWISSTTGSTQIRKENLNNSDHLQIAVTNFAIWQFQTNGNIIVNDPSLGNFIGIMPNFTSAGSRALNDPVLSFTKAGGDTGRIVFPGIAANDFYMDRSLTVSNVITALSSVGAEFTTPRVTLDVTGNPGGMWLQFSDAVSAGATAAVFGAYSNQLNTLAVRIGATSMYNGTEELRIASGQVTVSNTFRVFGNFFNRGLLYPIVDGTSNQVITTDGAGTLTFQSVAGGAGGGDVFQASNNVFIAANTFTAAGGITNNGFGVFSNLTVRGNFNTEGGTTLGDNAADSITWNAGTISAPNGATVNSGVFSIPAAATGTITNGAFTFFATNSTWLANSILNIGSNSVIRAIVGATTNSLVLSSNGTVMAFTTGPSTPLSVGASTFVITPTVNGLSTIIFRDAGLVSRMTFNSAAKDFTFNTTVTVHSNLVASTGFLLGTNSGGTRFTALIGTNYVLDFPSIASLATFTTNLAMTGTVRDDGSFSFGPASNRNQGLLFQAFCASNNSVSIDVYNSTGAPIDPAVGTNVISYLMQ